MMGVRQLFLMDCFGALVSAAILGVVLPMFEDTFGMPTRVLYVLAGIALVFAVYSAFCYGLRKRAVYLKAIAVANLLYCCLTAGLVFYWHAHLTTLGLVYFVLEMAVILGLVVWEWRRANLPQPAAEVILPQH